MTTSPSAPAAPKGPTAPTEPGVPARRVRNPRGAGAALGAQIVATAVDVVDEVGVPGLTLRGLARTIGVSAPAIYAHFADIDAILLKVAERVFADLAEHVGAAAQAAPAPGERLRAVCRAYLDYAEAHPGRYQVMFGGQWDGASAVRRGSVDLGAVGGLGQDVLAVFVEAVRASTTGEVREAAALTRATTTWVFLHGYAHQKLLAQAFPWPAGMTEHVLDCLSVAPLGGHPARGVVDRA